MGGDVHRGETKLATAVTEALTDMLNPNPNNKQIHTGRHPTDDLAHAPLLTYLHTHRHVAPLVSSEKNGHDGQCHL